MGWVWSMGRSSSSPPPPASEGPRSPSPPALPYARPAHQCANRRDAAGRCASALPARTTRPSRSPRRAACRCPPPPRPVTEPTTWSDVCRSSMDTRSSDSRCDPAHAGTPFNERDRGGAAGPGRAAPTCRRPRRRVRRSTPSSTQPPDPAQPRRTAPGCSAAARTRPRRWTRP